MRSATTLLPKLMPRGLNTDWIIGSDDMKRDGFFGKLQSQFVFSPSSGIIPPDLVKPS